MLSPCSPLPPMRGTDILQDLGEDEIKVTGGGLYSPMMRKHLREHDAVEQRMKEDSFEVTNKQADPDYEAIHFNRGRGSQRRAAEDKIESASVLDFSSKKRELVLGIDRKPELRPLSAFKQSPIDKQDDPQKHDTVSLEIDDNEEAETISDLGNDHQDADYVTTPEEATESETSTLSDNPFLKQQSNNFKFNKSRSSPRTTKAEFHSPPKQFVKRNLVDNGNLKKNLTAALIRQFNHGKSQESSPERSTSVKTSTKQLINKESINSQLIMLTTHRVDCTHLNN